MSWSIYRHVAHDEDFAVHPLTVKSVVGGHSLQVDYAQGNPLNLDLLNIQGDVVGAIPRNTPCFWGTRVHPITHLPEDGHLWLLRINNYQELHLCRVENCVKELSRAGNICMYFSGSDKLQEKANVAQCMYIYGSTDVSRVPLYKSNTDYIHLQTVSGILPPLGPPGKPPLVSEEKLAQFGYQLNSQGRPQNMTSWSTFLWVLGILLLVLLLAATIIWLKLSQRYADHVGQQGVGELQAL